MKARGIDAFGLCVVLLVLCPVACVTARSEATIEIRGAHTVEEKIERVRRLVTPAREQQLKRQVHLAFPDISKEGLDGLYLDWRVTSIRSLNKGTTEKRVAVVVGIRYRPGTLEADRVLDYCERTLRDELGSDAQLG